MTGCRSTRRAVTIRGFTILALLLAPIAVRAAEARPNILLCIADDWAWPHAGAYGDRVVKTPTFDRVAAQGVLFTNAFCAAPSCSASRASLLTGQAPHRLEAGADLWSFLPAKFPVYPDLLERAGYTVGHQGKGWGPGQLGDRRRNPAGPRSNAFAKFLESVPADQPFCFWFGSQDPHRPYDLNSGAAQGMNPADVTVPPYLPDAPEVRNDILDYYGEVHRFDRDVGEMLALLEKSGRLQNTIVVMTGDNGWPFPRCKANLYDGGTHVPLAVWWPAQMKEGAGRKVEAFVTLTDLCPTFLEAVGLKPTPEMTGRSILGMAIGERADLAGCDRAFVERERHANVRRGDLSYPSRAVRTAQYLYVRNVCPDLWPAGDPQTWKAVGPFGDIDSGPSKNFILARRDDPTVAPFFQLACAKRPAEELYDLTTDPHQIHNVAADAKYAESLKVLRASLDGWMKDTADPRATAGGAYDAFDKYPYYGGGPGDAMESRPAGANRPQ